jgi:hypothetical protein
MYGNNDCVRERSEFHSADMSRHIFWRRRSSSERRFDELFHQASGTMDLEEVRTAKGWQRQPFAL